MSPSTRYRVVIDTNLIIAGRYRPRSASAAIIQACLDYKVEAIYSHRIKNENLMILERVRPDREYLDRIMRFYSRATLVQSTERIKVCDDPDDDKYFEAAVSGNAQFIISNDRHLLDHDGFMGVRVFRPNQFVRFLEGKG